MSLVVPPYLPPRYSRDQPEVSAWLRRGNAPTSILMLFAPGAPREHYFEGMAQLGDMSDEERREWFIANDNFFIE